MNNNYNGNFVRGSSVVYQSFNYTMIKEILNNDSVQAWIRIWIYFSILQKYGKKIYAKNNYISKKLNIPLGTVKYSITKLRDEGLIEIVNSGTWLRQIKLTKVASIDEDSNSEIRDRNEHEYHSIFERVLYKDHVYLSSEEYNSLLVLISDTKMLDQYIEGLNTYLSTSVIKYKSHYELIKVWYEKNTEQIKKKRKKYDTPDYQWYLHFERGYLKDAKPQKSSEEVFWYNWLEDDDETEE